MLHFTAGTLALFGTDAGGVQFRTDPRKCRGWWGSPASTIRVVQHPRSSGGWAGDAYSESGHQTLGGLILAPTAAALEDAADRLKVACPLAETVLSAAGPLGTRWARVRREGEVFCEPVSDIAAEWSVQFVMTDPRKFGAEPTASTGLPSSTGGLVAPFTAPFTVDAVTVTGQVSLTNPGNATGPVRLRIDGPVTGPVVTHVGSGLALVFASSLVLAAGDFVTVDMEAHEVLAQGQSSRNGWITQRGWSGFEPGGNTWSFSAVSGSGTLEVTATEAWE